MIYCHAMKATPARRRLPVAGLAVAVILALAAVVLGVWRPWVPVPSSTPVGAAASEQEAVEIAPAPLLLPEQPTVLVFGDSWT